MIDCCTCVVCVICAMLRDLLTRDCGMIDFFTWDACRVYVYGLVYAYGVILPIGVMIGFFTWDNSVMIFFTWDKCAVCALGAISVMLALLLQIRGSVMIDFSTWVRCTFCAMSVTLVLMLVPMLVLLYRDVRIVQRNVPARSWRQYKCAGFAILEIVVLIVSFCVWPMLVYECIRLFYWFVPTASLWSSATTDVLLRYESLYTHSVVFEGMRVLKLVDGLGLVLAYHVFNTVVLCARLRGGVSLGLDADARLCGMHVGLDPNALCYITADGMQSPMLTPCGHMFEMNALCKWMREGNGRCPLCHRRLFS
jgi:hypothetical protein